MSLILEHARGISAIDSSISLTSINKLSRGMTFKLPRDTSCGVLRWEGAGVSKEPEKPDKDTVTVDQFTKSSAYQDGPN